jgi:hypothetical protein
MTENNEFRIMVETLIELKKKSENLTKQEVILYIDGIQNGLELARKIYKNE